MSHDIPTFTYILDAVGVAGIIIGTYVASKSRFSIEKSKDAVTLITLQEKRIKILEDANSDLQSQLDELSNTMHQVSGELNSYRKLKTIDPEIVVKLTSTLDAILKALTEDGIHIDTQKVDTQIIGSK